MDERMSQLIAAARRVEQAQPGAIFAPEVVQGVLAQSVLDLLSARLRSIVEEQVKIHPTKDSIAVEMGAQLVGIMEGILGKEVVHKLFENRDITMHVKPDIEGERCPPVSAPGPVVNTQFVRPHAHEEEEAVKPFSSYLKARPKSGGLWH